MTKFYRLLAKDGCRSGAPWGHFQQQTLYRTPLYRRQRSQYYVITHLWVFHCEVCAWSGLELTRSASNRVNWCWPWQGRQGRPMEHHYESQEAWTLIQTWASEHHRRLRLPDLRNSENTDGIPRCRTGTHPSQEHVRLSIKATHVGHTTLQTDSSNFQWRRRWHEEHIRRLFLWLVRVHGCRRSTLRVRLNTEWDH